MAKRKKDPTKKFYRTDDHGRRIWYRTKEEKELAKRRAQLTKNISIANKRLAALERAGKKSPAWKQAQYMTGPWQLGKYHSKGYEKEAPRYRMPSASAGIRGLEDTEAAVEAFLGYKTSTLVGERRREEKMRKTLNEKLGVNFSKDDYSTVFEIFNYINNSNEIYGNYGSDYILEGASNIVQSGNNISVDDIKDYIYKMRNAPSLKNMTPQQKAFYEKYVDTEIGKGIDKILKKQIPPDADEQIDYILGKYEEIASMYR